MKTELPKQLRGMPVAALVGVMVVVALICILALATTRPADNLDCFGSRPDQAPTTVAEKLAWTDARNRQSAECLGPWRQCKFSVRTTDDEVAVLIERANASGNECSYMPGDSAALYYDLRGTFVREGLSL